MPEPTPTESIKQNEVPAEEIHEDELAHMGKGDEDGQE